MALGRAAVAVFFGIVLLAVLDAVSAGGITYAPADTAAGMVHGLVALAVVFLVFDPALPYLHAEQVLAGLGGHRLGSGL